MKTLLNLDFENIQAGKPPEGLQIKERSSVVHYNVRRSEAGRAAHFHLTVEKPGEKSAYLRCPFELDVDDDSTLAKLSLLCAATNGEVLRGVIRLSRDPTYEPPEIETTFELIGTALAQQTVSLDLSTIPKGLYYGFFQIIFPLQNEVALDIYRLSLVCQARESQILRVHFATFGQRTQASSRLRAWMLGDELAGAGHIVAYNLPDPKPEDFDVFVFQKVMPADLLAKLQSAQSKLVYDFDDHFGLDEHGSSENFHSFLDGVDLVTCGSQHLVNYAARHHPRVVLHENPLDVLDRTARRCPTGKLNRIGWFGAPEGLNQLEKIGIKQKVTTVTRGGDIEFDLSTVDHILTQFDLLLFPLEITEWNLAKNANRMLKALALGVPVLCSDTPEHRRIAKLIGLADEIIVAQGEDWNDAIVRVRRHFRRIEEKVFSCANRLTNFEVSGIAARWLVAIRDTPTRGLRHRRRSLSGVRAHDSLSAVSAVFFNPFSAANDVSSIVASEVEWRSFGARTLVTYGRASNSFFQLKEFQIQRVDDPTLVYSGLAAALHNVKTQYTLIVPAGYALKHSAIDGINSALGTTDVFALGSSKIGGKTDLLPSNPFDLREFALAPRLICPLLVRTEWLNSAANANDMLGFYGWYLVLRSFPDGFSKAQYPLSVRWVPDSIPSLPAIYLEWLKRYRPDIGRDMPSTENQWSRITLDVVARCFSECLREWQPVLIASAISDKAKVK